MRLGGLSRKEMPIGIVVVILHTTVGVLHVVSNIKSKIRLDDLTVFLLNYADIAPM